MNETTCCATGEVCCNDECCDGPCCEGTCCAAGTSCCGSNCCDSGRDCCENETTCCAVGEVCCNEECCDPELCCATECCEAGEMCCQGVCELVDCTDLTLTLAADTICPGGTADMDISASCSPDCAEVLWTIDSSSPDVTVMPSNGSLACPGGSTTVTVQATGDAVPGLVSFNATGHPDPPGNGCPTPPAETLTILELQFEEDSSQTYGFDDYTNRDNTPAVPFKSVEVGKIDTAELRITPFSADDDVHITSSDTGKVTAAPATASSSPQTVTVAGVANGESDIDARPGNPAAAVCATMTAAAYDTREYDLDLILVHEENDDIQVIPVGQGAPDKSAILPGGNNIIDSTLGGDDQLVIIPAVTEYISTGENGICETSKSGDDVQSLPVGNGMPDQICVKAGANNFRDTRVSAGDAISGDDISTGSDGVCFTIANGSDTISTDIGAEAAVKMYLNETIYNQAVVYWKEVKKLPSKTVNFDLNRDSLLDTSSWMTPEMEAIRDAAKNSRYRYTVFLVDHPSDGALGCSTYDQAFVFVHGNVHTGAQTMINTCAHELGHALDLEHPDDHGDPDPENLMHSTNPNGERLRKNQWDDLHGPQP